MTLVAALVLGLLALRQRLVPRLVRGLHDLEGRVLARSHNEPRRELSSGDDERIDHDSLAYRSPDVS